MVTLIIILSLTFICVTASAFAAGQTEKRKTAQYWTHSGTGAAALAGVAVFFFPNAIKEILLKKTPHLSFMAESIIIPRQVMLQLSITVFSCGITLFLWSFNCRKNSSKWYWAALWNIGVVFLTAHLLFLPQYYGISAWINFFAPLKQDVFSLDTSMFPAVYAMLALNLATASLWLWHTLTTSKHSWKNILIFAGSFSGFVSILWLSAWGAGVWAKNAVDKKATELAITPIRVADKDPQELTALVDSDFYIRHSKYNPPRSGKYNWQKDTIPAEVKEYTMNFFTSPELKNHLAGLQNSTAYISRKDVLYLSTLQHFRSLVRHRMDIAELYFRSNQKEKVLPELLKYPELESLIPADTPFLICELVRTATRAVWVDALIQYGPEERELLPTYRKLLAWSKNWKVHLPCEAGFYLAAPPKPEQIIAAFFYAPYLNTARYRGFFDAVKRIPALKKLEQAEIISGDGMYAKAAKRQRLGMIMGQIALALKVYKIEHGKYPGKLSELVPNYLPKEYVSPSTGKKLDYSVKVTNFILSADGITITPRKD